MIRRIYHSTIFVALGLVMVACSTGPAINPKTPGWSDITFYDPICAQTAMEILNAIHVPHTAYFLPYSVWNQWRCLRNMNNFGRITLVLVREPEPYRLTIVIAENRRVIKASTDPKIWQEVIGTMAMQAWFDDLTEAGHKQLAKHGAITFSFVVRPG